MMDPMKAAAAQAPAPDAQPTVICIAAMPDGTFMVYPDNDAQGDDSGDAAGAGGGDTDDMANGTPAQSVDAALKLAKQMLTAGPGAASGQPGAGADNGDALFQQGFNQARGITPGQ